MKIRKIQLANGYKRFHDTTIDLCGSSPRIVALVGPNGCGKSSVLDGMLFVQNNYDQIGSGERKDDTYHWQTSSEIGSHQDISIEFEEGTYSEIYRRKRDANTHKTIFSFRSPYRYNSALKVKEIKATTDIKLNAYGASSAAVIDQKMEENYRRLAAKYGRYLEEQDCKPSEAKAHIIGELNDSIRACLDIEVHNLGNVEADQGSLYFTKYDQPEPFEFDVLSSGEKEVIDILLDLYLRVENYSDTIFLIDEPELHISTAIQKKLLIEVEKLIGSNCQIWVATHSIGLLRALQDELKDNCEVIYFEPGTKFASETQVLKPMLKTHDNWRRIFATALDDLSGLVCPKTIVYCEGKDRLKAGAEDGFDAKVYNRVFGEEFPEVLFVSSGGNTELDQRSEIAIKILSKAIHELDVLVLKDRDFASGATTNQEDRVRYLSDNPSNHRVLIRWEIENYLFDKEVLASYCEEHNLQFDRNGFDEFVTSIFDDNVKDNANAFKKFCGVDENAPTENFKLALAQHLKSTMAPYEELKKSIFSV